MVSMSVPIFFFNYCNEKVPVVESLFSEVTGEIYALSNSFENSNTYIGIFRKAALLKILRSSHLTGEVLF